MARYGVLARHGALGVALLALASLAVPLPQDSGGELVRFTNGEVADADDVNANFDDLDTRAAALDERLFDQELRTLTHAERLDTLEAENGALQAQVADLAGRLAALESVLGAPNLELLGSVLDVASLEELPDGAGGVAPTLRFRGVNLQVVNGGSQTDVADGTGNLILGFNEPAEGSRTGSHNLVLGRRNAYTGTAGIVAGVENLISGAGSSVLGGQQNRSTGLESMIVGGEMNQASGAGAVVGGGFAREAPGAHDFAAGSLFEDE